MRGRRRRKRLAAALLCLTLCAADFMSAGMTALAGEQMAQELETEETAQNAEGSDNHGSDESAEGLPEQGEAEKEIDASETAEKTETAGETETSEERIDEAEDESSANDESFPGNPEWEEEDEDVLADQEDEEDEESAEEMSVSVSDEKTDERPKPGSITIGFSDDFQWEFVYDSGKLTVYGKGDYKSEEAPWFEYADLIKSAKVDVTGMTNTSGMFEGCWNLASVDFSGFDTSQVTNMRDMFSGCSSLTSLNLSGFDTSQVTDMSYMFDFCDNLTNLNLNGFDTSRVTRMYGMFRGCRSLTELDLSSFDASGLNGTDYGLFGMFEDADCLVKVKTPYRVRVAIPLPIENGEIWSQPDGTEILDLPVNLNESIEIVRNKKNIAAGEDIASGSYGNITWKIDDAGKLTVTGSGDFARDNSDHSRAPWSRYRTFIKSAEVHVTDVTDVSYMFYGCNTLESADLSGLDTSQVTTMYGMFYECNSLTSLDLSGFRTDNVTRMDYLFYQCESLTSLNLSGLDTSQVTNMQYMFSNCRNLPALDVSSFDTGRVTNMEGIFNCCENLSDLDLSNFNTSSVRDMTDMFLGCTSLVNLDISHFKTQNVTSMIWMFASCSSLTNLDLSSFDISNTKYFDEIFSFCQSLKTIHTPKNTLLSVELPMESDEIWAMSDGTQIEELPKELSYSVIITKTKRSGVQDDNFASGSYKDIIWAIDADGKLTVTGSGDFANVTGERRAPWYADRTYIKSAEVNVIGMTDASYMLYGCNGLTSADLRGLDTSQLTNMESMLTGCGRLGTIHTPSQVTLSVALPVLAGEAWTRPDGTEIKELPKNENGSILLTKIKKDIIQDTDLASGSYKDITWAIDADGKLTVTGMGNYMESSTLERAPWYEHRALIKSAEINVTGMTNAAYMFAECENLVSVDVSGFDTSQITDMSYMFHNCSSLTNLDLSSFDISQVTGLYYMFMGCSRLKSVNLSSFKNSKVTAMNGMFSSCTSLTSLDLSGINAYKTTQMNNMDYGMLDTCSSLTRIKTPYNLRYAVPLPKETGEIWSMPDGTEILDLPIGTSESVEIVRSKKNITAGENIAGGKFEGITWTIDNIGKLTVEGNGDFSDDPYNYNRAPWSAYRTFIKSAEINVTGMTDADYMFYGCYNLENIDLSGFDTSQVTSMAYMFADCRSLIGLDLRNFKTNKVTSMFYMFYNCQSLTSLDLSSFDTSQVRNIAAMFMTCVSLETVDLSSFNTEKVTLMHWVFSGCHSLKNLDLSNFNTSKVIRMGSMFSGCNNLKSINVSGFDTGKVNDMWNMFGGCNSLVSLDLSSFDVDKVGMMEPFLSNCTSLRTIHTPRNLHFSVELPKANSTDKWYLPDGTAITELPMDLSYSMVITKNKVQEITAPYIRAAKVKTTYECGETVLVDDITVTYYDGKGAALKVTEGFTTNAAKINQEMDTPGEKTLTVSYVDAESGKTLTVEIKLTVKFALNAANTTVTLAGADALVYSSYPHTPAVTVSCRYADGTEKELTAGTDYTLSYQNNTDAGTQATAAITGTGDYSGTVSQIFSIAQAPVTIKAEDVTIAVGDALLERFSYETAGFFNGDEENVTGVSFTFVDAEGTPITQIDTTRTGTYQIIPKDAKVGGNYVVSENGYQPGILTIAEERVVYTVTFDMLGHGTQAAPIRSVLSGSLIVEPEIPVADGYTFTGWYQDRAGTKAWNFAVDTVQENLTLYARWTAQTASGGIHIQRIADQIYTGSAIKPVVAVYGADGTLLKSGRDYTIKYINNTKADQKEAAGGIYHSLEGEQAVQSGFDKELPYVQITGKGNHTGTVYANFHIRPVSISDAKGNLAAGFTLKYNDQIVRNARKDQKPFASLKYKKAMKTGETNPDFRVSLSAVEAYDDNDTPVTAWSAEGNAENKWNPAIPAQYHGTFRMTVEGCGNYEGKVSRIVYVMESTLLLKNASISLGKNQKSRPYADGEAVTLTPGYYDSRVKKYYKVSGPNQIDREPEADNKGLFTVKVGAHYLTYGSDYTVSYSNNRAVGTATMTLTGVGSYRGTKSVTFQIIGKAFKANTVDVKVYDEMAPDDNDFKKIMPYTGKAVTQNKVTLSTKVTKASPRPETLVYGRHYTIRYKNNIKKGTATMTFTAKPESGYSGRFSKTFKIGAASLADPAAVTVEAVQDGGTIQSLAAKRDEKGNVTYQFGGTVAYTKDGAKPSERIRLYLTDVSGRRTLLREKTDYTVSYANNRAVTAGKEAAADKIPSMTFKGKGSYTGSFKVTFAISEAELLDSAPAVSAAQTAVNAKKEDDYLYQPKITVKDGKKTLSGKKDYTVEYRNCTQAQVKAYLEALKAPDAVWSDVQEKRPQAVIKAVAGSGYVTTAGKEIVQYLDFYETKLAAGSLYVVVSDDEAQTTYKGEQMKPEVAVYYGGAAAVKQAKKDQVTEEAALTGSRYGLTKLTEQTGQNPSGSYTLSYGTNVAAGRNKGSVAVTGCGLYGAKVTVKFTIRQRNMYQAP